MLPLFKPLARSKKLYKPRMPSKISDKAPKEAQVLTETLVAWPRLKSQRTTRKSYFSWFLVERGVELLANLIFPCLSLCSWKQECVCFAETKRTHPTLSFILRSFVTCVLADHSWHGAEAAGSREGVCSSLIPDSLESIIYLNTHACEGYKKQDLCN